MEENEYTIHEFFEKFGISQSYIARRADVPEGVMRQYKSGVRIPDKKRIAVIQKTIRSIGKELAKAKIKA